MTERDDLVRRAHALIDALSSGERDDAARDALLTDILAFQARVVAPYARLARARGARLDEARHPDALPALPTDVFRHARVAAHAPDLDARVFLTSGTTGGPRGSHSLRDLSLYDRAARAAARHALFPDVPRMRLVILAPDANDAPESSLSYMLSRFAEWFGEGDTAWAFREGRVDAARLIEALRGPTDRDDPVALLGTSFAFAHADDVLGETRVRLAAGSRVMQTGGFKGRTRELSRDAMHAMLRARYGVADSHVVGEYGMTELSSQMYETSLRAPSEPRRLWVPGWMRAVPVDPETLRPVEHGAIGILRIDDVANVDTVCAVQTSDLARVVGDGIVLAGRADDAVPRGCSLAVEEALAGSDGHSVGERRAR